MRNLYWKTNDGTRNLVPKEFETESAFEKYVFKNQELLGDIVILYRQVRTGSRQGIPDMLGVDQDANICIIEMKNAQVSEDILPQILRYAIWAETNPDSVRAIWLESKNKPDDIQIDWDSIQVRVLVIAPSFRSNILKMTSRINYPIDLIQIERFSYDEEEFIFVETLEDKTLTTSGITTTKKEWTWEYYEENHGKEPTREFKRLVETLSSFTIEKGWKLPYNLNQEYTGFKFGNRVVFDVAWSGVTKWHLRIKIPNSVAENFTGNLWEFQRYDRTFNNALFKTKSGNFEDVSEMKEFLTLAYNRISGTE